MDLDQSKYTPLSIPWQFETISSRKINFHFSGNNFAPSSGFFQFIESGKLKY